MIPGLYRECGSHEMPLCLVHSPSLRLDKSPSLVILDPDFTGLLKGTVILGRKWVPEKALAGERKNGPQQKSWLQSQTTASWLFYQDEAG